MVEKAREGVDDEEGGDAEEGAEGELVLRGDGQAEGIGVAFAKAAAYGACGEIALPSGEVKNEDGGDADDAAEEGAKENGEECSTEAEEGADHGHHLDVTHAHAIAMANEFVEDGGAQEEKTAEGGAEKGIHNASGAMGEIAGQGEPQAKDTQEGAGEDAGGEGQAEAQAKEGDSVGEEADTQVGDDENDQQTAEEEPLEGGQGDAEGVVGEDEEGSREELNDGVEGRDGKSARAAFAAQEKPTEDGDVVVGLDGVLTTRAAGSGADDGEAVRDAQDANIQEAANDDAEEKEEEGDHGIEFDTDAGASQCAAEHGVSDT